MTEVVDLRWCVENGCSATAHKDGCPSLSSLLQQIVVRSLRDERPVRHDGEWFWSTPGFSHRSVEEPMQPEFAALMDALSERAEYDGLAPSPSRPLRPESTPSADTT